MLRVKAERFAAKGSLARFIGSHPFRLSLKRDPYATARHKRPAGGSDETYDKLRSRAMSQKSAERFTCPGLSLTVAYGDLFELILLTV